MPLLFAQWPTEFVRNSLSYGLLVVLVAAAMTGVSRCVAGAERIAAGEPGRREIYTGVGVGVLPWLAIGVLRVAGVWGSFGLSLVPVGISTLSRNVVNAVELAMWIAIAGSAVFCVVRCAEGARMLEEKPCGARKIFSGLAVAAMPWVTILTLNISGVWQALGLRFP